MSSDPGSLEHRLAAVRADIAEAAAAAGRSPDELTTIVVTKFHSGQLVRDLWALGVRDFGENRHQEASAKAAEVADLAPTWHFVGQLQSKKARQVRSYASVIHSLDRDSVVDALRSDETTVDCFIQLNLTDDPARGGIPYGDAPGNTGGELATFTERVLATPGLRLLGVMAVAPLNAEPRRAFAAVRRASEQVRALEPAATFISAGMSGDYREAILEGATHLRIGSAITGNRPAGG